MKKIFFVLFTFFTICFFGCNVYAANSSDSSMRIVLSYNSSNGTPRTYIYQKAVPTMRTVYIEDLNYFYIMNGSDISFYTYLFNTEKLPMDFPESAKRSFSKVNSSLDSKYSAIWDLYLYSSSAHNVDSSYTNVLTFFDYSYSSKEEFYADLANYNSYEEYINRADFIFGGSGSDDLLPMLTFKINQAFVLGESWDEEATVKYTFNWSVSEHKLYADNPNKYQIQMVASADIAATSAMGVDSLITNEITFINESCKTYVSQGIPIYKESYSFRFKDPMYNLCNIAGVDKFDWGAQNFYYLYVRIVDPETKKCSLWKVYKCQFRSITPTGYAYDDSGEPIPIEEDDEIDDSAEYDDDPRTDSDDDPNSPFYNDGTEIDAKFLLNNLEEIVSMLKSIPDLFSKVFSWMPASLVILITTSIGLMIVVGFVKMFLR